MRLDELLETHSWRVLRAITRAHRRSFDNHWTKAQAVAQIRTLLLDPDVVRRAVLSLPENAKEALQTLVACEGAMPAPHFLDQFGPLRPYRPWREDSALAPWRNPLSPAERLLFLGFIFLRSDAKGEGVTIPDELLPLLPTLPSPERVPSAPNAYSRPDPILDIAHLLAYVQGENVTPFAGRWLTPRHLRALDAGLAHADPTVADARSELQTSYVRFLHYLAQSSGLVGAVGGFLKPMPTAWTWLDGSESERWQILWQGWQRDLRSRPGRESLWDRYRLPAQPAFVSAVFEAVRSLPDDVDLQEDAIELPSLALHVRRRCIGAGVLPPEDDLLTSLQALVTGPFTWGRIANTDSECNVVLTREGAWLLETGAEGPDMRPPEPATVHAVEDRLVILLPDPPDRPPLRPMVTLALPSIDRRTRHFTRQRFVSLLANGVGRIGIIELLRKLTADALPSPVIERLESWETEARGLSLRRLTVLSVADTEILDHLTHQRTIRPVFREMLSPHHIVVDPNQKDQLLRALRRRGHTPVVEPGADLRAGAHRRTPSPNGDRAEGPSERRTPPATDEDLLDEGAAAHLWLALRTYLNLADLVELPAVPPVALLDLLEHIVSQERLAELEPLAEIARQRLNDAIDGYSAFPAPLPGVDRAAIQAVLEQALQQPCPIKIVYHTAGRGERTERVVEPLRLDERGGARYLIAYCRLRHEERVFRLNRIETAILED